jgi:hypothetical protein
LSGDRAAVLICTTHEHKHIKICELLKISSFLIPWKAHAICHNSVLNLFVQRWQHGCQDNSSAENNARKISVKHPRLRRMSVNYLGNVGEYSLSENLEKFLLVHLQ